MASLTDLREGLAAAVATTGLPCHAYLLGNPTPPCAWVIPGDPVVDFDETMGRGLDTWHLVVEVFVALTTDKGAQLRLDPYMAGEGATSLKAAIEADGSLGGVCDDLRVESIVGVGEYNLGDRGVMLGFRTLVTLYATSS